jgi:hypothetical protein
VAPGTGAGVVEVPLIAVNLSGWPATLLTSTYVLTLVTAFQVSVSPETLIAGAACVSTGLAGDAGGDGGVGDGAGEGVGDG